MFIQGCEDASAEYYLFNLLFSNLITEHAPNLGYSASTQNLHYVEAF